MPILNPQVEKMDIVCSWDDQQRRHNCIIDFSDNVGGENITDTGAWSNGDDLKTFFLSVVNKTSAYSLYLLSYSCK